MPALNAHKLSTASRIELAKDRTARVVDHFLELLLMHESNRIVVYSDVLAQQILRPYTAQAFNQFQLSMHAFEIVRLCALWDGPDRDKENIPTILDLLDEMNVADALVQETRAQWPAEPAFASSEADRARQRLFGAIKRGRTITASPRHEAVMNIRHKHLAHSLTETSFERSGTVQPMKYGDEHWLFEETAAIVGDLHHVVNRSSFDWDGARQQARRNAAALWHACRFT